ncbi:TetR family transcriptional regulator [Alcanivorax sp. MD8A]|uniref:TetR/AcrR family transcriptional regulator n=1 Tax=Alcanivorax sp. MD8A TaxID=1177157 RepID=UPI000C999768|nr:TetR/AcrR family transcriptional regulator [Alcanivorax sp. MD8A]PNE03328.1 TetR family transcriptional regulator [Alcanivorax sp. MD8A]
MPKTERYHHGDLHDTLLQEANALLNEQGVEGLSLRKLAERAGVSRTAPYHHFRDKNALLCALATQAFARLDSIIERQLESAGDHPDIQDFVIEYLEFATENPEQYELMFGRTIWKSGTPTEELKRVAYRSFRRYAEGLGALVQGRLPAATDPLRVAQASWATIHGLCRLVIDGVYVDREDMQAVSQQAVALIMAALK